MDGTGGNCTDKLITAKSLLCIKCSRLICYFLEEDYQFQQPFYVIDYHLQELSDGEGPLV